MDPTILRKATLRNVELGHDLQTGDHGLLELLDVLWHGDFAQATVDPVAHAELVLHRLHMDIRGVLFESLANDLIHEFDDGRFFIAFINDIRLVTHFEIDAIDLAAFENLFERVGTDAVKVAQGVQQAFAWCDLKAHCRIDLAGNGLAGDEVQWVKRGDYQLPLRVLGFTIQTQWQQTML